MFLHQYFVEFDAAACKVYQLLYWSINGASSFTHHEAPGFGLGKVNVCIRAKMRLLFELYSSFITTAYSKFQEGVICVKIQNV